MRALGLICVSALTLTAGCKDRIATPPPPPKIAEAPTPAEPTAPAELTDPAATPPGATEAPPETPPMDEGTAEQLLALRTGTDAMARGDRSAAMAAFVEAFDGPTTGASISAGLALAELHQQAERAPDAEAIYARLLQMAPEMAEIRFTAGRFYSATGKHTEAVTQLRRAIALEPDFLPAYPMLGGVLANTGQQQQAAELMLTYETRLKRLIDRVGDPSVQPARKLPAIDVFALIDDDRVTRILIAALRDASTKVRLAAADALVDDPDAAALEALATAALAEQDPIARRALTASLKAAKARFDAAGRTPTPAMPAPGQ